MSTEVKERPLLFTGEMVRAILGGRKTQTRRVVSPRNSTVLGESGPKLWAHLHFEHKTGVHKDRGTHMFGCGPNCDYLHVPAWHPDEPENVLSYRVRPVNEPGDRLWVKETFVHDPDFWGYPCTWFRADYDTFPGQWKPSIFMRRAYSRITLEITEVCAERLNDISEADAQAEGCHDWSGNMPEPGLSAKDAYRELWERINGAGSWKLNPWVWVITFRRLPDTSRPPRQ